MKKACLVVSPPYDHGEIFNRGSKLNRDDCLIFFHELKSSFAKHGVDLNTQDVHLPATSDIVIYNEMPKTNFRNIDQKKSFLLLFESELIRPDNWFKKNHDLFKAIFTWHDSYVDEKKYFKFNFTHSVQNTFKLFAEKQKFCTLIAGSKSVSRPNELYSERIQSIRWFEKNAAADFEFYGVGWGLYTFKIPVLSKVLNRITSVRKLFALSWPSYRGPVDNKLVTLSNFKFSICYENAKLIPGYITEKIFDSLSAGCIPIYWGAPNISQYIPRDCYIDRTQFKSHVELYHFLKAMTEAEYNQRIESIKRYLASPQHQQFESIVVAEKVVKDILSFYEN